MHTGSNDNRSILELAAIAVDGASKDGNLINLRALARCLSVQREGHTVTPEEIEAEIVKLAAANGVTVELGDPDPFP